MYRRAAGTMSICRTWHTVKAKRNERPLYNLCSCNVVETRFVLLDQTTRLTSVAWNGPIRYLAKESIAYLYIHTHTHLIFVFSCVLKNGCRRARARAKPQLSVKRLSIGISGRGERCWPAHPGYIDFLGAHRGKRIAEHILPRLRDT